MLQHIKQVLTPVDVRYALDLLADAPWSDGRASAGTQAALVKNNTQLPHECESTSATMDSRLRGNDSIGANEPSRIISKVASIPAGVVTLIDHENHARKVLDENAQAFFYGGAGDELTLHDNCQAWSTLKLQPRVLQPLADGHTRTQLLGKTLAHPIFLAPVAYQRIAHPDGELATAHAAAARERRANFKLPVGVSAVDLAGLHDAQTAVLKPGQSALFDGLLATAPTWADMEWLQSLTRLPIILKDILHEDDARQAASVGLANAARWAWRMCCACCATSLKWRWLCVVAQRWQKSAAKSFFNPQNYNYSLFDVFFNVFSDDFSAP